MTSTIIENYEIIGDEIKINNQPETYGLRSANRSGNVIDMVLTKRNAHSVSAELHLPTAAEAREVIRDLARAA